MNRRIAKYDVIPDIPLTEDQSLEESESLWDKAEEMFLNDDPLPEPKIIDIASLTGEYVKKQSQLTSREYLESRVKPVENLPVFVLGDRLIHPKRGYGFVTEAFRDKKNSEINKITARFGDEEIDFDGTDEELLEFFKEESIGDVITQKDETGAEKEMVVVEELPDGTAKVKDKTTGEEKIVEKELVKPKPASKKTAQDTGNPIEDMKERYNGLRNLETDPECVSWFVDLNGKLMFEMSDGNQISWNLMDDKIERLGTKKQAVMIGDEFNLGGYNVKVTNIYTLDQFGDVMIKLTYDNGQEVSVPYESFLKEVKKQQEQSVVVTQTKKTATKYKCKSCGKLFESDVSSESLDLRCPECNSNVVYNVDKVKSEQDGLIQEYPSEELASKKIAQEPDVEKTELTEPEGLEELPEGVEDPSQMEPAPGEMGPQPEDIGLNQTIWQDVLEALLLDPEVATRVIKKMLTRAMGSPELLTKLDSLVPENGEWTNAEWLKKNSKEFFGKLANVFSKEK